MRATRRVAWTLPSVPDCSPSIFRGRDFGESSANLLAFSECELIIRRELYAICLKAAILFTLVVFLLLPILFFWKPVHA